MKNNLLKSILVLSLLSIAFLFKAASSQRPGRDSLLCLQIEGKISSESGGGKCLVELISYNQILDSALLEKDGSKFRFLLKKNCSYTIRVTKQEHVVKLVCIDTSVPDDHEGIFRFRFNTKLMETKSAKTLNRDALELPVALIYYDHKDNCFDYCKEYTSNIKREWYRTNVENHLTANR